MKAGALTTEMLGPVDVVNNPGDALVPILDEDLGPLTPAVSSDLSHVTDDGDCSLLKFDQEMNRCVDFWPSVAEFINESLDDSKQADFGSRG